MVTDVGERVDNGSGSHVAFRREVIYLGGGDMK
jgi:hypothetical protein